MTDRDLIAETLPASTGLAEQLARHREMRPRQLAFRFLGREDRPGADIDWATLWQDAAETAGRLRALTPPRARIAIACEDRRDFVVGLCACLIGRFVAVPLPVSSARRSMPRAAAIAAAAGIAAVLITRGSAIAGWLRALDAGRWTEVVVGRSDGGTSDAAFAIAPGRPDDIALIQFTSGTTGRPSGIALSHANLAANCSAIAAAYGLSEATRGVSWLPLNHDMGLVGHVLTPIWLGCRSTLMEPLRFLQRPLAWLRLAASERATITSAPNFAFETCLAAAGAAATGDIDLSSLTAVVSGGEPVLQTTVDRFLARFQSCGLSRAAFAPSYGLAEATLLVASGRERDGPRFAEGASGPVADLGRPVAGVVVRILREDGQPAAEGEVGEIAISGTSVGRRLLAGAAIADAAELRTGDLGFLKGGRLHVAGRIKELIILRGQNVYPADVEAAVLALSPAIAPGGVAALGIEAAGTQRLVLVVELDRKVRLDAEERERLRRDIVEGVVRMVGHVPEDVRLLPFGGLPRTASGKIRRAAAAAQYAGHEASATA